MRRWIILVTGFSLALPAQAFDLGGMLKGVLTPPASTSTVSGVDTLSNVDITAGLKEALTGGVDAAVAQLGQANGFFGNPAMKIPLPSSLQKAEKAMRMFGMGSQADQLVLSMNRAAEAVVPEAKPLLIDAVKEMTLEDARGILTGGQTAATDYFRSKTEVKLSERFGPIVKAMTDKVGLAQEYDRFAGMAAQFNLVDKNQASVEQYVTQQALDRLYTLIGEREVAIRANPLQTGSDLLKQVFGAVSGK